MAVYKVPQDVEADDKLIGPFSFRQFVYLIVVAISAAGAWGLSQIFVALAILPLPIILFFAALALPLRKDQPMEAYLSAVVSFYFLKSRKRFWQPDGIDSFITIIPPKDSERILTKDLDETEATRRLNYLADLVDTHGWAIRGAGNTPDTSISTDLYYESQQTPDMMDNTTPAAQAMSQQLADDADERRQDAIAGMQTAATQPPASVPTPATQAPPQQQPVASSVTQTSTLPSLEEIRAREAATTKQQADKASRDALAYANALAEQAKEQRDTTISSPQDYSSPTTSVSTPDTATMELTKQQADELSQQTDVSVQTLAHEANRVAAKNKVLKNGDEVTISFR
jgi:hypothetical protein